MFSLIEYIDGVPLRNVLGKKEADDPEPRLLREDISDADLEFVYRQMVQIMLQLFKLEFNLRNWKLADSKDKFSCT